LKVHYELIDRSEALADLVARFSDSDAVVIDTEFMRRDTYYPQAALFQLCYPAAPDTAWLIDPLAVTEWEPLRALLLDTSTMKVVHSASEDLEVFQTFLGCQPAPLFDTQRAAAFVGLGFGLGYRRLVEQLTGAALDKDETRSDWLKRPLSAAQLDYAAADVVPLLPVYQELYARVVAAGRLEWILEDGAAAAAAAAAPPAPSWRKVKSAWKLPPRQLAVLQEVCEWRDNRARKLDKPRSWILPDKLCLALAQRCPVSEAQLRSIPEMPPAVVRRQGSVLLDVIARAQSLEDSELPQPLSRPLDASQRNTLKRVKQAAAELAGEWQVEPEVLLPAREYELIVRLGCGESVSEPASWNGWRRSTLIEPLLKLAEDRA
jgi:ribonuclease D